MRKICEYCKNKGNQFCKQCNWIHTRYPTEYLGEKFTNKELKGMDEIIKED